MKKAVKKNIYFTGDMFVLFLGHVGQGKTLVMNEDYVLPALIDGQDVFSTYWVNWNTGKFHITRNPEEFVTLRNCLLAIDELADLIDKIDWERYSQAVKKFFMYHRHFFVDIVANTQSYEDIAHQPRRHISRYFMCERHFDGDLLKKIWPRFPWVTIKTYEMTKNEVMLLDKARIQFEDDDSVDTFKAIATMRAWYKIKNLYHFELDQYKQEYIHFYCPICNSRHGDQIPKEETGQYAVRDDRTKIWLPRKDLELGKCPKHPDQDLTVRTSFMYDSNYLPEEKKNQPIIFKPFVMGQKLVPFRGDLTEDQQKLLKKLNNKV